MPRPDETPLLDHRLEDESAFRPEALVEEPSRGGASRPAEVRVRPEGPPDAGVRVRLEDPEGSCQVLANFRQDFARFRLYRHRSLQANTRFAAFFKIYQII